MGFRMNVCRQADRQDYTRHYGDDHKLYGYYAFEDVAKSFVYICHFMKNQWEELNDDKYDDPREIYDYICYIGATDDLVLSEKDFKEFSKLYLKDVFKNKPEETYNAVCIYMQKLADTPGNKLFGGYRGTSHAINERDAVLYFTASSVQRHYSVEP